MLAALVVLPRTLGLLLSGRRAVALENLAQRELLSILRRTVRAWCAKTRPIGLRCLAVVELEHAAEPSTACDRACADRRCLGRDELVAQTLVRPLLMIMLDKRSDGSPEVPFAEWYDPLQALGLGGPH